MEDELSLKYGRNDMGDEGSMGHHSGGDHQDDMNQGFHNDPGSSANCNLIVNYLPHDIDDLSLKVKFKICICC